MVSAAFSTTGDRISLKRDIIGVEGECLFAGKGEELTAANHEID